MNLSRVKSVGVLVAAAAVVICQFASVVDGNDLVFETPPSDILIITMGGTPSHKIPFMTLAEGLIAKGHRVTLLSGYAAKGSMKGLEEIVPEQLKRIVTKYGDHDYLGIRIRNEHVGSIIDAVMFGINTCSELMTDPQMKVLLKRKFDLLIIDSFFMECAVGVAEYLQVPFMFFNTMTNFLNPIVVGGNPAPWSITPCFFLPLTNRMTFLQRVRNTIWHIATDIMQRIVAYQVQRIHRRTLYKSIQHPFDIAKNVSFILQNGHVTVSHSQPFLPKVAEIGGIHCRPAKALPKHLNDYLDEAGEEGFVYVSMGTSVNPKTMPPTMLKIIVAAFSQLPYRVLWKFDTELGGIELPANVRIEKWLPQQDVLGHKNIRVFVSHSGIFGTLEAVYHGVPIVTMPVFADQDSNAAKVVEEGYGLRLELKELSADGLVNTITRVANDPQYKTAVKRAQRILLDQPRSPLDTAVYWSEYVIRHKGATHFDSPTRHLNWIQLYNYDGFIFFILILIIVYKLIMLSRKYSVRLVRATNSNEKIRKIK